MKHGWDRLSWAVFAALVVTMVMVIVGGIAYLLLTCAELRAGLLVFAVLTALCYWWLGRKQQGE